MKCRGMRTVGRICPIIMLFMITLLLSGCGYRQKANFESGVFGYTNNPSCIMIGVRSDTNTFSRDNITLDLYYGFHDIGYDKKYNFDPKSPYLMTEDRERVVFGLYIGNSYNLYSYNDDELFTMGEYTDYKSFEHHYFLKEISDEDAFSKEYGFTMTFWDGVSYNHHETITIPEDCLVENEYGIGFILIEFWAFCEPQNEGKNYIATQTGGLDLRYEVIDKNTIKINFLNKKQ